MKLFLQISVFFMLSIASLSANPTEPIKNNVDSTIIGKIKWYTWLEAVELQGKAPKIIMVDLFTEWCGWCKRMDATTFEDDKVAAYLNAHFYPVKFDAEQKEDINYGGKVHHFVASGRTGYHELAAAMVDNKLGYPNFVYFNEKMERIMISPGYKGPDDVMVELRFAAEGRYLTTKWEDFKAANAPEQK